MADEPGNGLADLPTAAAALEYLAQLQPDLRMAAIIGPDDEIIQAGGGSEGIGKAIDVLVTEIHSEPGKRPAEAHIATGFGEVFVVWEGDLQLVAVAERFVLASLLSFDMRTVLRDLNRAI